MKQKLIKLSDTHYIVVDDSQITAGYVTNGRDIFLRESMSEYSDEYANRYWEKITHSTQPLSKECKRCTGYCEQCIEDVKPIELSEVEEAIYGYSVEKMAAESAFCNGGFIQTEDEYDVGISYYHQGFKAHQELTKDKLFTVEDMRKYHNIMCLYGNIKGEEYIQSLLPKTECDIEIVEGKIKLL